LLAGAGVTIGLGAAAALTRFLQTLLFGIRPTDPLTFAGVALLLGAVGLYGVMAWVVAQRTREIGIRMALGAGRAEIFRLVVSQGLKLVTLGGMLGLAGAFAATRWIEGLLHNVPPRDPATLAGVTAVLALTALAACYIPARRATRVDPMVALRYE